MPSFCPEIAPRSHILHRVSADGINYEGAGSCAGFGLNPHSLADLLGDAQQLDPNAWFQNGEHIVCAEAIAGDGICAFLQATGGAPGSSIPGLIQALLDHGCTICGSVPLFYPINEDSDPNDHGILTVNYVESTDGCSGVC
jgi:hypothetical protein